jgi:Stress responsive A/B Barrel Domain
MTYRPNRTNVLNMIMKKILGCIVFVIFISASTLAQHTKSELRHVVLFGWKENANADSIGAVITAFKALPGKIEMIKKFEWGINNSPEKLNQGLTHCFLLTFSSEKERDDYLVHPTHIAFTKLLPGILDKVTVIDYWAQQ